MPLDKLVPLPRLPTGKCRGVNGGTGYRVVVEVLEGVTVRRTPYNRGMDKSLSLAASPRYGSPGTPTA